MNRSAIYFPNLSGPLAILLVAFALCSTSQAQKLVVAPHKPSGVYKLSEKVSWDITWQGADAPAEVRYTLEKNGLEEIGAGTLPMVGGATILETVLSEPGTLLVEVTVPGGEEQKQTVRGGAVVAPQEIQPSADRPDDFDQFWEEKIAELQTVAPHPILEKGESGKPGVDYWLVTMDNIRGTHIHGQLARPAGDQKLPALLIVQWAGVYGLEKSWVTDRAADGWLALDILSHDLPIDKPKEYYEEQLAGPLKDYWEIGNDDRETSYFLRMYLSCYRAAEYLTGRPDWNGETLVVMGVSQGGQQSLVTAALHPRITAALAGVPAGCDMLGPAQNRAPGFPMWYWKTSGRDPERVHEASRYFDTVNFMQNITCPVLVGTGLIDNVCPPAGVLAAVNQMSCPKELVIGPHGTHDTKTQPEFEQRFWQVWLPALRDGRPTPVAE